MLYSSLHYPLAFAQQLLVTRSASKVAGYQEPGSERDIKVFAEHFNVNFHLFAKVHCNKGQSYDEDPLYTFLKAQTDGKDIQWNFEKILTDKESKPQIWKPPKVNPFELEDDVRQLIA